MPAQATHSRSHGAMRQSLATAAIAVGFILGCTATNAATYAAYVTGAGFTETGRFTTDGKIGVLSITDFTDTDIIISGPGLVTSTFTSANAVGFVGPGGTGVTATAKGLFFDYSDKNDASSGQIKSDGSLYAGFDSTNYGVGFNYYKDPNGKSAFDILSGTMVEIAAGVPEPSTWTMLLVGLAGLGGALRVTRRGKALAHGDRGRSLRTCPSPNP